MEVTSYEGDVRTAEKRIIKYCKRKIFTAKREAEQDGFSRCFSLLMEPFWQRNP